MPEFLKDRKVLIIIPVAVVLGACAVSLVILVLINSSQSEGNSEQSDSANTGVIVNPDGASYPCLMQSDTSVSKLGNQQFEFVITAETSHDWGVMWKDNGVRQLNISQLSTGTSVNHLYLQTNMSDGSYIPKGQTMSYQVCDKNNNTIQSSYFENTNTNPIYSDPGDGNSLSAETEISDIFMPKQPGIYRYDGIVYTGGQWVLVARLEDLQLSN